ncbi:MAG: ABC transporter ATP-binding protein [candidate division Zixibacteria bacterium]|nr:ABC transporter ATP-binding protein [candidate division Zixibacteria bacterium]NIR64694.1 ABC transporter ATP-binding protein [candidate division Zixibacteria bacterium]NIS15745.1 ABC transporter ATP-binding protein [candidate division Zixibacteria bacterium]NIS45012.1 ABC transporter ATP-binding protein [candidate division Zixibacteria bacterium]NIT52228.1 ABC transporter ATP-binding protein [candidate division Zixibacteria bacterium]
MTQDSGKIRRLLAYLKPYWLLEIITFIVMAAIAVLGIAVPAALQYMIDTLIPSIAARAGEAVEIRPVIIFGLVLVGIYIGQFLLAWLRDYLAAYIGANIIMNMRSDLFIHVERLSLSFFQRSQVGEIMSRVLSDVNRIQGLLTTTLLVFFTNIFMLIAIIVYLLNLNWYLTLVSLIPVPFTILLTHKFGKRLHQIARMLQEKIAHLSARLQETLVAIKTVKAFGQEKREKKNVDNVMTGLTGLYIKNSVVTSVTTQIINFVSMLGPIIILSWGTYLIAGGSMQIGQLMAFYILLTYLYSPIEGLARINIEVQSAMASVNRVYEYLDIPAAVEESPEPVEIEKARGEIEFKNVSFSYETGGFKFENLNLKITAGEKIAIVGPSGSGKSTIINLLMRFYDPLSGEIMVDDTDLKKLSFKSLRDNIVLVDQEPLLFRSTIYENIVYGVPDVREDEVIKATKNANIHDFIESLPQKYESQVGERGVTLSGGEKQRVCLARAIIRDPSILILDEATSALDSVSEQLIQDSLSRVLKDKTAIMIAHRLSTIQHADRIIVLQNGKIIDQGTSKEIMQSCELYRELVEKQQILP